MLGEIAAPALICDEPLDENETTEPRRAFDTLIANLSVKFINLPAEEIDAEIEDAQCCVCQCLCLDVSALWQWSAESPGNLALTHLYRSLEGPPAAASMDAKEYFPWCLEQLLAGKVIAVSSLEELPAEANRDRESWQHFGIKNSLTIPLAVGGGPLIGAVSFNDMTRERVWSEALVERLQIVAQIFANAITRKRSEQILRESEERLSLATEAAGLGVWIWDIPRNEIWANEKWHRLFGFSPKERIRYETVIQRIHRQDREMVDRAVRQAIEDQANLVTEYRVVLPDGTEHWVASRGRLRSDPARVQASLLGVSVDVTERKRAEQALEERLRFEQLLTDLSANFINQPPDQIDSVIDESLRGLLETLGHDRSSLAAFRQDTGHAVVTHSCAVSGIKPFPVGVVVDDYLPWYVEAIRRGNALFLKRLPEEFPPEAKKEREVCLAQGVKSTVAIPLRVSESVLGIISFSFLRRRCEWPPEIVSRLQMIGEIFANALARKRSDGAIRAALAENEQLRNRLEQENVYLREQITLKHQHGQIVGKSLALKKVLSEAERVAGTDTPVLILGETGTGKELLAQAIHEGSQRKDRPMVIVNCASLPATLIESELFGREAGAYTGAASAQVGRFEIADGSTLFLDEIGEFPIELQAKLLRVLQDGGLERLGSPKSVTVNVRIIAATNRNLEQAVRDGKFRADLYHRLNVFPIRVPPLRDRREDIPLLVWLFVEMLGRRMGKTISSIPRKTMEQLQQYDWPGNVRELSNVIERAMILTSSDSLHVEMPALGPDSRQSRMTLDEGMREQILRVLQNTGWRIRGAGGAAEILGIKPTTLESRMAKLGITRPSRVSDIS
jgi:PAS domain S-box-containing protein